MDNFDFYKFENQKDFDSFKNFLFSQGKDESVEDKQRHQAIMNSKKELIGLSMSANREIAKKILKEGKYIGFLSCDDDNIFEICMIQGLVIAQIKDFNLQVKLLDKWLTKIDSWGLCDSVVSTMKWLKKEKNRYDYFNYFYKLCYSSEEYIARFGIVVMMSYYLEGKYIDQIYKMCSEVDRDVYYIQMAIAWLISFGFVKFHDKTVEFLQNKLLLKFTQNKAISKCKESFRVSAEDKEKLNKLKI